ncbi:hypothetical protein L6V77_07675 [Myxococcota bacterium]|nr:hypothetical protein [Myxococcota bacterium]
MKTRFVLAVLAAALLSCPLAAAAGKPPVRPDVPPGPGGPGGPGGEPGADPMNNLPPPNPDVPPGPRDGGGPFPAGGRGQITTGGTFAFSKFIAPELELTDVGNGKKGPPGVCFQILAGRQAGATKYGEMCSYGEKAPRDNQARHEVFYWTKKADAWVDGRAYFLKVMNVKAYEYAGPVATPGLVEAFDNTPKCVSILPSPIPATKRWAANGALGTAAFLVRGVVGGKPALTGYWRSNTCIAVEPDDSGWIELKPSTEQVDAKAKGTAG